MVAPKHTFDVTIMLNNALAQGGAFTKHTRIEAETEEKALMIADRLFKGIDYEFMEVHQHGSPDKRLWDVEKVKQLKEEKRFGRYW